MTKSFARPLVSLDIESTGNDPVKNAILDLALIKVKPGGYEETFFGKYNGRGQVMTPEVVSVHGITNEMAATYPELDALQATAIADFIADCDLLGYNLRNFDLIMLQEELLRAGVEINYRGQNIIDAGTLFKIREPRDLTAAVKFYCGCDHAGEHGAEADARATLHVLNRQIERYRLLDEHEGPETMACILAKESSYPDEVRVDLAGKIVLKNGVPVYNFGNSKGRAVRDDPSFGEWMLTKDFSTNTKQVVRAILDNDTMLL